MIIIGGIPTIIGIMIIIRTTILLCHQRKPNGIEVILGMQVILLMQARVKKIHKLIIHIVKIQIILLMQARVKKIHNLMQTMISQKQVIISDVENIIGSPYDQ